MRHFIWVDKELSKREEKGIKGGGDRVGEDRVEKENT